MTFRQYIQSLAESIGLHQIPVLIGATEIRYFLAEDAVHHHFVTKLIRELYRKNACGHLDAKINTAGTITLLYKARAQLLSDDGVDICKVRLINQICDFSTVILNNKNAPGLCEKQNDSVINTKESIQ